jgi:hypothetical protein
MIPGFLAWVALVALMAAKSMCQWWMSSPRLQMGQFASPKGAAYQYPELAFREWP